MNKIIEFLNNVFAPKVTYWYNDKQVSGNSKSAELMKREFEKLDEVFNKINKAFDSLNDL